MTFFLTSAPRRDYSVSAGANHQTGLASCEQGGQPPLSGFFTSVIQDTQFMGGSCGEPKGSPVLARYANPHESAHPIGVGRAENINRLARSNTMPKSTKRASAPVLKLITKTDSNLDYVNALRTLLLSAERGDSAGLAYIEITNNGNYRAEAIGSAEDSPTFCLGALEVLKAKLLTEVMG